MLCCGLTRVSIEAHVLWSDLVNLVFIEAHMLWSDLVNLLYYSYRSSIIESVDSISRDGPVSQDIWHPRKFGTPVPYILGYYAPPWEIWHPFRVRNYGTPIPNILGKMAPHTKIS